MRWDNMRFVLLLCSFVASADALAALLTRQYVSGLPNTSEFAAHALSSNVCAAAFRQSLADARVRLIINPRGFVAPDIYAKKQYMGCYVKVL